MLLLGISLQVLPFPVAVHHPVEHVEQLAGRVRHVTVGGDDGVHGRPQLGRRAVRQQEGGEVTRRVKHVLLLVEANATAVYTRRPEK